MAITFFSEELHPLKKKIITFSGSVSIEGSPGKRLVCLLRCRDGTVISSTYSDASTGNWSIEISGNANDKVVAVCFPREEESLNADIYAGVSV
jgi:hypothetical protein